MQVSGFTIQSASDWGSIVPGCKLAALAANALTGPSQLAYSQHKQTFKLAPERFKEYKIQNEPATKVSMLEADV